MVLGIQSVFALVYHRIRENARGGAGSWGKRGDFLQKQIWKLLLGLGIFPMVLPFLLGLYHMWIESWTMADWLVLYSFLYWWTYPAGLVLIVLAFVLKKRAGGNTVGKK